jgi:hypothetical protein
MHVCLIEASTGRMHVEKIATNAGLISATAAASLLSGILYPWPVRRLVQAGRQRR